MKFYTDVYQRGNTIYLRGRDGATRVQKKINYEPYLFVKSRSDNPKYRSLFGAPVDKVEFESIFEARDFIKRYEDVDNFDIYGLDKFVYPFINDYYSGTVNYDPDKINIGTLDIETASENGFPDPKTADQEITAITIKRRNMIISLACGEYDAPDGVIYIKCKDEKTLLIKFLEMWKQLDLDILTGWNVEFFDIPYIVNRITRLLGDDVVKSLSPWKLVEEDTIEIMGRVNQVYHIRGLCVLDYMQLYKKFTYTNQESYKLDHIAFVELGERKLDYSEYDNLRDLYKHDFQKFMDYNIHDVNLVERLDNKLNLIGLALTVAYDAKINYDDVFTSVRLWDVIIHNELMRENIVVTRKEVVKKTTQFAGAFVKDPIVGLHEDVVSFDVESLYPSLIVQYNISPETYRGKHNKSFTVDQLLDGAMHGQEMSKFLTDNNVAITANSCLWDKDFEGVFPKLIQKMMIERKQYKALMLEAKKAYEVNPSDELKNTISKYDNLQMARKILLNSLYGALGNQYFRWFEIDFAEAITLTGQLAIRWTEKHINTFLDKATSISKDRVIAIDTDSVYLNLNDLVPKHITDTESRVNYLDTVCAEVLENKIKGSFDGLVSYTNAYKPFLKMKREAIANKGIWTAKKRYILNVYDNEGVRYAEPKLKMMGIEAVKSSTPSACREKIKQSLKIIMTGTETDVQNFIKEFQHEFNSLSFDEVAFPRGCNGLAEYSDKQMIYKKGTPIHVRGALVYNNLLRTKGLDKRYEPVKSGEKIKFCYMKLPNPIRENVISVVNTLPAQLNLDKYIDYNQQFTKAFLEPLKGILDAIGYQTEKRATLESFFS